SRYTAGTDSHHAPAANGGNTKPPLILSSDPSLAPAIAPGKQSWTLAQPPTREPSQIFATTRPEIVPAFSSSRVRLTSDRGRVSIGIGLSLPARASATTSFNSATVPTLDPWIVSARCTTATSESGISPPYRPTMISRPPLRSADSAKVAVAV